MTLQQNMLQIHVGTVSRVIVCWLMLNIIDLQHLSSVICHYSWIWDDRRSDLELPWV